MTNGVEFAMTGHISPDLFVYLNQSVLYALTGQNCGGGTGLSSASLPSSPFSSLSRQQGSPAASAHPTHLFPSWGYHNVSLFDGLFTYFPCICPHWVVHSKKGYVPMPKTVFGTQYVLNKYLCKEPTHLH